MHYKLSRNITESVQKKASEKKWILIDAKDVVLGRLAAMTVHMLKGKHLPEYTPNADCGDNIVIINCAKVALTGKKNTDKLYRHHTGHPGGMKVRTAREVRFGKNPSDMIKIAVKRMLGKGPLANTRLSNLHLYDNEKHDNIAQQPSTLDFKNLNRKNTI